jgi:ABC-type phosphate transport system auxiliary subunit
MTEQTMPQTRRFWRPQRVAGEPFVWVTAMGLTVGLAMIVYLLGLILVNGYASFWPGRVVQVELTAASHA